MSKDGSAAVHAVIPLRVYFSVFVAILALSGLSVLVTAFNLGVWNTFIPVTVAIVQAVLGILFFMHVRYSERLIWIVAASGFLWLLIMFAFTLSDTLTRGWIPSGTPLPF